MAKVTENVTDLITAGRKAEEVVQVIRRGCELAFVEREDMALERVREAIELIGKLRDSLQVVANRLEKRTKGGSNEEGNFYLHG